MSVIRKSYLDLAPEVRRSVAAQAKARISTVLADPFASEEKREQAKSQLQKLQQWERGILPKS